MLRRAGPRARSRRAADAESRRCPGRSWLDWSRRPPAASEVTTPTVTIALSAPTPRVSWVISSWASSAVSQLCVAPSCSAASRLLASGSMATTLRAPASAAPCTELMPMPPMP